MIELHTAENEAKIERLWAFLSIDEEGNNGVVATVVPGIGAAQMIFGKRELARAMIPRAQEIATLTGKTIALFAFKRDGEYWRSE
jgi:hypothetical protein